MIRRRPILLVLLALALPAGAWRGLEWWRFAATHVSTDDAYLEADVTRISARVAGTVMDVQVESNDPVEAGALLVRLDPEPYEIRLREAEAELARAVQEVEQNRAALRAAESRIRRVKSELAQARLDHTRLRGLADQKIVSRETLDQAATRLEMAAAALEEARRDADRARANLGIPVEAPSTGASRVRSAEAARDRAALRLTYTEIRAPSPGVVAHKTVEPGEHVEPGQTLMALVGLDELWVEANFKETALADMRIGQRATIVADAFPGTPLAGRVESISPGTGVAFSLLPPENATGNWVKVVQRVPVKIVLDEPPPRDRPFRLGLSVVATIEVGGADAASPPLPRTTQR